MDNIGICSKRKLSQMPTLHIAFNNTITCSKKNKKNLWNKALTLTFKKTNIVFIICLDHECWLRYSLPAVGILLPGDTFDVLGG